MADTPDFNQILETFLKTPGLTEQLSGALGALTENAEPAKESTPSLLPEGLDIQKIMQLKNSYETLKNGRDERIELLLALKPFLNHHRAQNVDSMVKMLRFSKLTGLLKELDLSAILS